MVIFFFNDTATTEIYTLSLHDALPIWLCVVEQVLRGAVEVEGRAASQSVDVEAQAVRHAEGGAGHRERDRKSTRLNSSHANISYAVFCLKKKKKNHINDTI